MNQTENLGPAERIIQTVLTHVDHIYHGRPGYVFTDATNPVGVKWHPVTHKVEGEEKVVYKLDKVGKKQTKTRIGVIQPNGQIKENGRVIGEYRRPGLFPEVAAWMYKQVVEVWKLDNEFAARWASYAYKQEHQDMKTVLAAFMLVQSRKGDPVLDGGKLAFYDEDFRDVGESMILSHIKKVEFKPLLLVRIHEVLKLPAIAAVNRDLGFGKSARHPALGRWPKAVEKWLRHREENPKILEGLVAGGWRTTVIELARRIGYKPSTSKFFEVLRWKQEQAEDGRRSILIGQAVTAAVTWDGLNEKQICERIVLDKPNFKRLVGLLPKGVGLTRAMVAALIESGGFSNKDLLIHSPTLEELGLLEVPDIRSRWEKAVKLADDMRSLNVAQRLKHTKNVEKLQEASDNALKSAVEEVTRNLRIYFMVDISSSMSGAIEQAKEYISKFLQAFPPEQLHVSVFNTVGRVIEIKHDSAAGVTNAFKGVMASGGTSYAAGVKALQGFKPQADEDTLFILVGDEEGEQSFENVVKESGLNPLAFGFLRVLGTHSHGRGTTVVETARKLGVPCFRIDNNTFADSYAIPRTIRALVAATPVGARVATAVAAPRVTLVEQILKTDLLKLPVWANAA